MPALHIKLADSETTHLLQGERITVGRGADNMIQILDRSVSSHHAELVAVNGHFRLHDLESTNLTLVDGEPVKDCELLASCKIAFGLVQCEFDSAAPVPKPLAEPVAQGASDGMSVAELEKDVSFLRAENSELRGKVDFLQSRLDMLGSARLVTRGTDSSPKTASAEALKSMKSDRDEWRHRCTALELELDNARAELSIVERERDAVRQAVEMLEAERQRAQAQIERAPAAPLDVSAPDPAATQRIFLPLPSGLGKLLPPIRRLRAALESCFNQPANPDLRHQASEAAAQLLEPAAALEDHVFLRLARGLSDLLRVVADAPETPLPTTLRTLRQAGELLAKMLEPRPLEDGRGLPPPEVLMIDDDREVLGSVEATLHLAELRTTGCASAEAALAMLGSKRFDLLIVDVGLPGMDGVTFCAKVRELPAYRKTPVLFLTVADTLDKRAETSLSGGSDFIAKPFNVFELALKVQTWAYRHQLGLH